MKIPRSEYEFIFTSVEGGATYASLAQKYDVTVERIRQICKRAKVKCGIEVRRKKKIQELWGKLDRISYEMFYEENYDPYDLMEECILLHKREKWSCYKKGVPFEVEVTDITWNHTCPISRERINYYAESRDDDAPIITRIDPSKGFIKGNVHTIRRKQ